MRKFHFLWVVLLGGCTMAPKYEQPAAPVAAEWPSGPAYEGSENTKGSTQTLSAYDTGWRDCFNDPRLQQLIGLALQNNHDLRVALLNVEATRAQYRIQGLALIP